MATTSTTVTAYWAKAGFRSIRRNGAHYLSIDEAKIRSSPEFLEVWKIAAQSPSCHNEGDNSNGDG
jgi:hypothetical protein